MCDVCAIDTGIETFRLTPAISVSSVDILCVPPPTRQGGRWCWGVGGVWKKGAEITVLGQGAHLHLELMEEEVK